MPLFSLNTDGKIDHVEIYGFQKRYNPEKYYVSEKFPFHLDDEGCYRFLTFPFKKLIGIYFR